MRETSLILLWDGIPRKTWSRFWSGQRIFETLNSTHTHLAVVLNDLCYNEHLLSQVLWVHELRKKINGAVKCCEADPLHLVRPELVKFKWYDLFLIGNCALLPVNRKINIIDNPGKFHLYWKPFRCLVLSQEVQVRWRGWVLRSCPGNWEQAAWEVACWAHWRDDPGYPNWILSQSMIFFAKYRNKQPM